MALQITYQPNVAKPILGMVPPGGFHYFQGDVRLESETLEGLYSTVMHHRAANSIPHHNTREDVDDYLCGQNPQFCHGVDEVKVQTYPTAQGVQQLLDDIQTWAKNLLASPRPHPLVGDELAEARAKVCGMCSNNVNWRGGCGPCITATDRLSASVRQARETESSKILGGCSILRHDNRASVFMNKEDLAKSLDLPKHCWLNE
jgi:hypothetical protein